jgi:hypothetical protein
MIYFHTKNPNLSIFGTVLEWRVLLYFYDHMVYFIIIFLILWSLGIHFPWYIVPRIIWQPHSFHLIENNGWKILTSSILTNGCREFFLLSVKTSMKLGKVFFHFIKFPFLWRNPASSPCQPHPSNRVARFFLAHDTKTVKNVPNEHKMYPVVIKYPKWQ